MAKRISKKLSKELDELTQSELLKPLIAKVQAAFEEQRPVFELNRPVTLTIKMRNGTYLRRPFIGEERFIASSCYLGKRDGVIAVFRPHETDDYAFMEMSVDKAKENLEGFGKFIESVLQTSFDGVIDTAREEAAQKEEEANRIAMAKRYEGKEFGSW